MNKRPVYSAKVIRYALFLRYTSIQSYKILLEDFPLPSLSLLQKIARVTIDVMKCAEMLRNDSKISDDICLLFDETYLQKREEYFGGDMMGSNDAGELYKGLVCFIIGLKQSILYIIRSLPEVSIDANWLKEEIFKCLDVLCQSGFNVRSIICDNHPSNVSNFRKLLASCDKEPTDLLMEYNSRKIICSAIQFS